MSKLNRITKFIATSTLFCLVLAVLLFGVWTFAREGISDDVAYHQLHPGQTRQEVERIIPHWTPRTRESFGTKEADLFYSQKYPGYYIVRYEWLVGIYVYVYYDGKDRVFMTGCNG